jgi:hypothetical protein
LLRVLYPRAKQLHIIDGEELKYDPVAVMNRLQHFLEVSPFHDYREAHQLSTFLPVKIIQPCLVFYSRRLYFGQNTIFLPSFSFSKHTVFFFIP